LLFSIFAILSGATSYRKVHAFIKANYEVLDETFDLGWKRLPAYTTIRAIIQGTSSAEIEESFRQYSDFLANNDGEKRFAAFDGKVLRGRFDHFQDQKVERMRRVFDTKAKSWKQSDETSLYIATTVLSAEVFCQAIRNHWGIENRNHHIRDVTMGEDGSRIRTNPHIFAKLRSFALNILRANNVENASLELFNNCMNLNNILNYAGVV